MTLNEAKRLEKFHDNGYRVLVTDSPYVDTFCEGIYQLDEDCKNYDETKEESEQDIVYDSNVFTERSLTSVNIYSVFIFKPVDFEEEKIEFLEKHAD